MFGFLRLFLLNLRWNRVPLLNDLNPPLDYAFNMQLTQLLKNWVLLMLNIRISINMQDSLSVVGVTPSEFII